MVIETLGGNLYANVDNKVYELALIQDYKEHSRYFENNKTSHRSKIRSIPKPLPLWSGFHYDVYKVKQKYSSHV